MKLTKKLIYLAAILLCVLVPACKDEAKFEISGKTADGKDVTFRLVMYTPSGIKTEMIASRSGKFEYAGPAPEDGSPIYFDFYSNDYRYLGTMALSKGEKGSVTLDAASVTGFRADGNAFNRSISDWLSEVKEINNAEIEKFVRQNPDNVVSMVLMTNLYDASANPETAYKTMVALGNKARPVYYINGFTEQLTDHIADRADKIQTVTLLSNADTLITLRPEKYRATILTFSGEEKERTDSVVPLLRKLTAENRGRRGLIVDHALVSDTLTWKRYLRNDTCTWTSVWSGAGPASAGVMPYGITNLPYFIVADSTSTIVYRGTSAAKAADTYRKTIR